MNKEQRGDALRKILHQIRERDYPYKDRPKKPIKWSAYDLAQVREMADIIMLIRDSVDGAARRITVRKKEQEIGPGRPSEHHPADITKVLLMQSYFEVPNRVAEGLLLLFSEKLGIRDHFSYKTIERGYDKDAVNEILDEVFKLTNEPVQGLENDFSVDGSGKPTSNKANYAQDRQRQKNKGKGKDKKASDKGEWPKATSTISRDYQYHVGIIGVKYKLFASWVSTSDHSIGELGLFPKAMSQAMTNQPDMERLLGDGLYANRPVCNIVHGYGVKPVSLPRRNVTFKRKGSDEWVKLLGWILNDTQGFLSVYHMRSISETGFSMVGRANPSPLRKHLEPRKATEDYLNAIVHNIKRLCYLRYLENLEIPFSRWRGC